MDKLKMHSVDGVAANIEKIGALFPNCVTETMKDGKLVRAIDFDMLRQELSDVVVEGPTERYQFTWPEKRKSVLAANAPTTDTLRPDRATSEQFDTTENLYIEGDNLVVLKLLQETYLGRIKVIYIDPPYNTGSDFVYADNFSENAEDYIGRSGDIDDEGNRLVKNINTNGRFHTDWLNMIYPRLRIAKNLLATDGVIFTSVVVWIVKRARDEHRQAIEWLNQHTDEQIGFFLVEIELWQIDDSAYAPMFKVVERPNDWAKEIKKVSATSNATQQARLEYWTAFNNYAFANKAFAKEFKQRKPSTDHWMSLSIGTSACGMSILRLQQQSQVGVELYINDDKELFRMLYGHKEEIEAEIGEELDWRELPEKKASRILIKRNANLTVEQEWPQQFEWVMDKLVKMKKTFKKYI